MSVVDGSFNHPLKLEEEAAAPLAGGMMRGHQCGMVWGAALAAGAEAYRQLGPDPQAERVAILAAQRLVASFQKRNKTVDCSGITGIDWKPVSQRLFMKQILKFLMRGGPVRCFWMAAKYAPAAAVEVAAMLSEKPVEPTSPPVSCTAGLARRLGASELHAVIAAGLAGGIGLSGGACGALGAAIWLIGMSYLQEEAGEDIFTSKTFQARANNTTERFLSSSGGHFRCFEIVGRRFEDPSDHAAYLRLGGCAEIIEALVNQGPAA